jgi:hypothetical protein
MLFKEIIAVYCENRTEHINTLYAKFFDVKAGSTYGYHSTEKVAFQR